MTGHRAGHLARHVLNGMTGSVAGHDEAKGQGFGRLAHPESEGFWVHRTQGWGGGGREIKKIRGFRRGLGILPVKLAVMLLALTGCHLIDQTDFEPKMAIRPAPPPLRDPDTRAALVTIDYAHPNPDYAAALTAAIHAAETRRPGLLYDVVAVVATAADAPAGQTRAAEVMTDIEAAGVIPARIRLGLRLDPARKIPQVRVYLR